MGELASSTIRQRRKVGAGGKSFGQIRWREMQSLALMEEDSRGGKGRRRRRRSAEARQGVVFASLSLVVATPPPSALSSLAATGVDGGLHRGSSESASCSSNVESGSRGEEEEDDANGGDSRQSRRFRKGRETGVRLSLLAAAHSSARWCSARAAAAAQLSGLQELAAMLLAIVPQRAGAPAAAAAATTLSSAAAPRGAAVLAGAALQLQQRAWIGALAGGFAGGLTNAVLHPIDTVKTRLQVRGASKLYSGPVDVIRKVVGEKGVAGLYAGLKTTVIGSVSSSALYFGSYEMSKALISANFPAVAKAGVMPPLAAAVGNLVSSAILVPKEVIKQRLQVGLGTSAMAEVQAILASEGIKGLYVGYSAALLRNMPSNVINFTVFESIKSAVLRSTGKQTLEPWQSFTIGACSGATAAAVTTPLDVAKTRLMTQLTPEMVAAAGGKAKNAAAAALFAGGYKGLFGTLSKVASEEGVAGLTRGMGPRLLYSSLFGAIGFFAFESAKSYLTNSTGTSLKLASGSSLSGTVLRLPPPPASAGRLEIRVDDSVKNDSEEEEELEKDDEKKPSA